MAESSESRKFAAGYDAGRIACLTPGHEEADRQRAQEAAEHPAAFWEGWSWELWDYEDANGLPHAARW